MRLDEAYAWLMITFRAAAFLVLLPALTGSAVPASMRMALSLCLGTLLYGIVPHLAEVPTAWPQLVIAILGEIGLGLLMGFVTRLSFNAVEMAGRIMVTEIGLTPAPGVDAPTASSEPLPAFLYRFAVLIYFLVGGHLLTVGAFARSFHNAPPGQASLNPAAPDLLIKATGETIAAGVELAAPFIALNFLVTLAFALLGRAVPKINVFVLSFSARSLAGLAMLGGAGMIIARYLMGRFQDLPYRILEFLPGKI